MKYQQQGFAEKPPAAYIEESPYGGRTCYLRKGIAQGDDGTWSCVVLQFDAPDGLTEPAAEERIDELWAEYAPDEDGTDALLTDMYEQMLSMQEAQEATDAALCDLYEALGGEQ
ncbi:hypothetical protein AAK967_02165 [Atopobiaceae bacterium 24-176]